MRLPFFQKGGGNGIGETPRNETPDRCLLPVGKKMSVFVDVLPDTFNMDPASLEAAISLVMAGSELRITSSVIGSTVWDSIFICFPPSR